MIWDGSRPQGRWDNTAALKNSCQSFYFTQVAQNSPEGLSIWVSCHVWVWAARSSRVDPNETAAWNNHPICCTIYPPFTLLHLSFFFLSSSLCINFWSYVRLDKSYKPSEPFSMVTCQWNETSTETELEHLQQNIFKKYYKEFILIMCSNSIF